MGRQFRFRFADTIRCVDISHLDVHLLWIDVVLIHKYGHLHQAYHQWVEILMVDVHTGSSLVEMNGRIQDLRNLARLVE